MEKKRPVIIALFVASLFITNFYSFIYADVINLKSGRRLEGEVVEKTDTNIMFKTRGITITYPLSLIESIEEAVSIEKETVSPLSPKISMEAIKRNDVNEVKKVIEQGADVNAPLYEFGLSPLTAAAMANSLDIAKLLIDNGADVNAKNDKDLSGGSTALIWSAGLGHLEILKLLIDNGADVNAKDETGITALMNSAQGNLLAERTKKVNKEDFLKIAKLLIDKGADVNETNIMGVTALTTAVTSNFLEMTELLIENGTDVNIRFKDGTTALKAAEAYGHNEIATLLKKHGAK